MRKTILAVALALTWAAMALPAMAADTSEALYPEEWRAWPVVASGTILGNAVPVPDDLPAIVRETVHTYNWLNDGQGSAYVVRLHPDKLDAFNGDRVFSDGATAVLELTDAKAILVTDHLLGSPLYGAYSYDGDDLAGAHPSLSLSTCVTCHTGYNDYCTDGVCAK